MTQNITEAVERALTKLDSYDQILRAVVKRMFDEFESFTYTDVVSSSVANRAMQLIFGFTTLVRNDNYSTAHHLIRIHLDNYLRYSALWLKNDPHPLAKRIYTGEKLKDISHDNKNKYSDNFLAKEAAKQFPWVYDDYEKLSGYIHFSQTHIKNASELIDEKQKAIGLHASKYDMLWGESDRLEGITLMEKITIRLLDPMVQWCETKERGKKNSQESQPPQEYVAFKAPPLTDFEYEIDGEKHNARVMTFDQGEGMRYRIRLNQSDALVLKASDDVGKAQWVQEARQGVELYRATLVQALGKGLEKAGLYSPYYTNNKDD